MDVTMVEGVVLLLTALILAWDIGLWIDQIEGNTISEIVRSRSQSHPLVPFLIGMLMGHWFW